MPEGPQVRRAGNIVERFVGAELLEIRHPPSRTPWEVSLPRLIRAVEVVGKQIFVDLGDDIIMYNHMLMWGSWRATAETFGRKRLNTAFVTNRGDFGYFGGGILKLISAREAEAMQQRIGPEILKAPDAETAFARVAVSKLPIGEALLSQELVGGIGNIYKSEGLFAAHVHPLQPALTVPTRSYERIFAFLQPQMHADIRRPGPITTAPLSVRRRGIRTFVYRRAGEPCLICRHPIARIYQGAALKRSTYFCPRCQPQRPAHSA